MDRPVIRATAEQAPMTMLEDFSGQSINGMTFRGRAERLGWSRGSVCDAGGIQAYHKLFPTAGVEAFILLMGMFVGMDVNDEIELGSLFFVKAGSVRISSYEYDEPDTPSDPRLIPLGEVPPVVFSETMGAMKRITAKKGVVEED